MSEEQSTVEYRELPQYPGYRVGSDGSVWSAWKMQYWADGKRGCKSFISEQWQKRKPQKNRYGYLVVGMPRYGKTAAIHRLVLEAFVGACPAGMECCHNDGNKANNRLDNLRWGTKVENAADVLRHGRRWIASGEKCGTAVLDKGKVLEIRSRHASGEKQNALAAEYGVSKSALNAIILRRTWKHLR